MTDFDEHTRMWADGIMSAGNYVDCNSCGCETAPADLSCCTGCGNDACHGCLHNGECATCVDVWRERNDREPVGRVR